MATETYYALPAGTFSGAKIGNFQIVDGVGNTVLLQRVVLNTAAGTELGTIAAPVKVSLNNEVCPWLLTDSHKFGDFNSPWGESPWT
jgi:hypothetical protein